MPREVFDAVVLAGWCYQTEMCRHMRMNARQLQRIGAEQPVYPSYSLGKKCCILVHAQP